MIFYWILFIFVIVLCQTLRKGGKERNALIISLFLLFVFFAFREGFTPDFYNYENAFFKYHGESGTDESYADEIGFQMLCKVLPSYRALLIVFTLLYCMCAYIAICKYVPKDKYVIAFAVMFLITPFLLGNMTGMRSGFVTCFFFLAIFAKGLMDSWVGIAIAAGIIFLSTFMHTSALALLPLVFVPTGPFNKFVVKGLYMVAAIMIIAVTLFPQMLNQWITDLTTNFFEESHYDLYLRDNIVESQFSPFSIARSVTLFYILYLFMMRIQAEKRTMINLITKFAVLFVLLCLLPQSTVGISRFQYYFAFPTIIAIPNVLNNVSKNERLFFIGCISYFIFYQMRLFMQNPVTLQFYMFYDNVLF